MNLTLSDLRALPLASALMARDGDVIAHTPEWQGGGVGSASYPVRRNRLVVCVEPAAPACTALLDRLLCELDSAAMEAQPRRSQQVRMLASSLRLVAGRCVADDDVMQSLDVLELARAGIEARTSLHVTMAAGAGYAVRGGEAAALVLVQFAVNAERHADVHDIELSATTGGLGVHWRGEHSARVTTARRREDRRRWGLGFARIAADAMGGTVHPPAPGNDGRQAAVLEVDVPRLALPLAAVRDQRVLRATRSWDDEIGALPGTMVLANQQVLDAVAGATREPGSIARAGSLAARSTGLLVWLAVPPDDVADRARDVVDGLTHEQALVDGVAEPRRSRISALAQLLACALGSPLQRVPAAAWTRRMRALAGPFGLQIPVPDLGGPGAAEPAVAALLAAEAGDRFDVEGESLWLRLRAGGGNNPLVHPLVSPGAHRIRLG
ncbi:MAG TPA: hypothetical protein VF155_11495 [Candidatus Dormibacteraeota bacterium]